MDSEYRERPCRRAAQNGRLLLTRESGSRSAAGPGIAPILPVGLSGDLVHAVASGPGAHGGDQESAVVEHLAQFRGELGGLARVTAVAAEEAAVVAGEDRRLLAQQRRDARRRAR